MIVALASLTKVFTVALKLLALIVPLFSKLSATTEAVPKTVSVSFAPQIKFGHCLDDYK